MDKKEKNDKRDLNNFLYMILSNCLYENEIFVDAVEKLLSKKIDVNYVDPKTGNTLLMACVENNLYQTFCLLLKQGAEVNYERKDKKTICHLAAKNPDSRFLEVLLKEDLNFNHLDYLANTPINEAIKEKKLTNIKLLVNSGVALNFLNSHGDSIYDLAWQVGDDNIISYLNHLDIKGQENLIIKSLKRILHK